MFYDFDEAFYPATSEYFHNFTIHVDEFILLSGFDIALGLFFGMKHIKECACV